MPSHKHKKKKKSHKRSKRRSSSISEDNWSPLSFPLSDSDSDLSSNEKHLTTLVRKTYINHLKQALMLNFEYCSPNKKTIESESVEEMVNKWSRVLELKALRTCMVSELYRSSMASLIKQVKSKTNDNKLYIEDKSLSRLKSKLPVNVMSQTEFLQLSHETQTEEMISSTLKLPLSNCSFPEKLYDPAIDFSDSNSEDGGVSSSIGSALPQCISDNRRNQDICNISSTSDHIDFADLPTQEYKINTDPVNTLDISLSNGKTSGLKDFADLPTQEHKTNTVPADMDLADLPTQEYKLNTNTVSIGLSNEKTSELIDFADLPTQEYQINKYSVDTSKGNRKHFTKGENSQLNSNSANLGIPSKDPNFKSVKSNERTSNLSCNTSSKKTFNSRKQCISTVNKNLDERLSSLRLLIDKKEGNLSQPTGKSKKSNWFAEETAQSCNLTRELMRMTTRQREKVLMKIKALFGDENIPLTELSEANLSVCRKRIASVVVMELTPVYQGKRIASRHLFKFLAKKITRSIMEKTLAPDGKDIRWRVKKYFEDGKVIMSESDCM